MSDRPCVVIDPAEPGVGLQLGHYNDTPRAGILLNGTDYATVFPNRRMAWRAVERSRRYEEKHGLKWGCARYRVTNLRALGARPLRVMP